MFVVGVGEIPLKRRGLDLVDGQNGKLGWDDRREVPCTDPPHSPQPSRLLLRRPRQILLTALTCTVPDPGPWYQAWLCEDVVGPVRALPSRDSTSLLQRISGRQGRFLP